MGPFYYDFDTQYSRHAATEYSLKYYKPRAMKFYTGGFVLKAVNMLASLLDSSGELTYPCLLRDWYELVFDEVGCLSNLLCHKSMILVSEMPAEL